MQLQDLIKLIELAKTDNAPSSRNPSVIGELGRYVIVRSRDAGVIFGQYAGNDGSTVHIKNARQLWSWTAAKGGTLLDCATHGVSKGKFSDTQTATTVFNACAIIDCTDIATISLKGIPAWA